MSGGCGGSSTSSLSFPSTNEIMNGAWVYNSGTVTANVNGMRSELTVLNFAVLFESCDIEEESGSAVFAAVAPLQGEHFMLPIMFDKTAVTTTRNDSSSWTADTEYGRFTIELLDDNRARLTGSVNWFGEGFASADIDVVINKLPSTAPTIDINTALDGEWQTPLLSEDNGRPIFEGGGYIFHEGNITPIGQTFMTMTFKDTNIQEGNMTATGTCIQEMTYSDEYDGTYIIMDHTDFNLEHMFGACTGSQMIN